MNFNAEFYLSIIWGFLFVNIILVLFLVLRKLEKEERYEKSLKRIPQIVNIITGGIKRWRYGGAIESYRIFKQSVILEEKERHALEAVVVKKKHERKLIRKLSSSFKIAKIQAAVGLAALRTDKARSALEKALIVEKDFSTKLYFANALSDIGDKKSLPVIVESLIDSHFWYRNKVNMLICGFEDNFLEYIPNIIYRNDFEIKELIVEFSSSYISNVLKNYLLNMVDGYEDKIRRMTGNVQSKKKSTCFSCVYGKMLLTSGERFCKYHGAVASTYSCRKYRVYPSSFQQVNNYKRLIYTAVELLNKNYYKELDDDRFYQHEDVTIRNIAVEALHNYASKDRFNKLLDYMGDESVAESAIKGIRKVLVRNPVFLRIVYDRCLKEKNRAIHNRLIEILSNKIEYLIMKLYHGQKDGARKILKEILIHGKTSQYIWFMNSNHDEDIEIEIIKIVREVISIEPKLESVFVKYLDKRLVEACGLIYHQVKTEKRIEKRDKTFIKLMYALVIMIIVAFPIIYVAANWKDIFNYDFLYHLRNYIVDFNYFLAFYSLAINSIFVFLLIRSYYAAGKQVKLWELKNLTMLFKKRMLPSVSIIAPAYNEERTIIESVSSLLNLKYPNYELIVVNDGSRDSTMETLVRNFGLERIDYHYTERLKTMPIRGVYMNPSHPKLIVVDKENGGKADALNAGINISSNEYFCGIDADSMLEEEALLKLASMTLDAGIEIPALGGNILPINGCVVDKGTIVETHIPKRFIARLQTVEYVRSFMTGRLGWASINCMLIISGAFGLFRKERVIGIGGYLTSREKYGKDTVGEDMELVVRIRRLMYEMKLKHEIAFSFDANCWTQVPEDRSSLKAQRQRWGRGLADTMTFHRRLLFNPEYGRVGMIAMPFFFIFELAGPIVEIEGYIMLILALILGYLNTQMAMLLFITTILLGVFVSMASFIILGKSEVRFSTKDVVKLLWYAIIENFGPRQVASLWRAGAIFKLLRGNHGWEKAQRKKFKSAGMTEGA